jgi:hypothetical protein
MPSRQPARHPLSYDEAAVRAGVSTTVPLGVRPIRVKRIVGSAGKASMIGPDFLPLGKGPAQANFQDVMRVMKNGETLPPITVYQLGSRYFVIDGHTRVAAAKELGIDFLDAEVIEALPRKEGEANVTTWARREFERYTGLEGVRLTAAWRYHLLHRHIDGYRLYLERSAGRDVTLPEAARIWYRAQYLPTMMEIRRRKLTSDTGGRTAGDVYTDILRHWSQEVTRGISLREMLDKYDQEAQRTPVQRAVRTVARVVDATLPKAVPAIGLPTPGTLAADDVEAELEAPEPGTLAEESPDGARP